MLKRRPSPAEMRRRTSRYLEAFTPQERKHLIPANLRAENVPPKRERKPQIGPSEHQLQVGVIQWWRLACKGYGLPEFALFAIPNGGARDPITGSRLKAEGVRKGIPDLFLAAVRELPVLGHPMIRHGLFIEMKRPGGKETPEQKIVGEYLWSRLYEYRVCHDSHTAVEAIKEYLR